MNFLKMEQMKTTTRYRTDQKLTDMEIKRILWIIQEFGGKNKPKLNEYIRNLIYDIRARDRREIKNRLLEVLKDLP